ncbi:MAG: hypothetical protein E7331_03910 [Clostridiales bacterium]|nr:hypothetical protein [Clostridiales bacterium]
MILILLMLIPWGRIHAEGLDAGIDETVNGLDLTGLLDAMEKQSLVEGDGREMLKELASGRTVLQPEAVLRWVGEEAVGIFISSLWRMTRLMVPALLTATGEQLFLKRKNAGLAVRYVGMVALAGFLISDLEEYVKLCNETVGEMAGLMQAIFPLLITLLAAVGGTSSSAFYQPAVMAAAGSMTTLIQNVTLPFAVSVAVLTMADGLSEGIRLSRMRRLFRQVAHWTLGFGFTVFIGVMTVQGVGAAAVDGVSIRTAKYAIDNFVPVVGGMFADTVDTLVGCSLLVENAVGVLGLILLLAKLLQPLLQTAAAMLLYRGASALMQPMADTALNRSLGEYGDVFSLLFIIELSVGAMFLLLCAQLLVVGNLTVMLR